MTAAAGDGKVPAVLVENLTKSYRFGRVKALDGVSLRVEPGDIFGLIGPNGAGKTTLMGCMLALLRPRSGNIRILGKPPDHIDIRHMTGFLPERPSYEVWMTAKEFLRFHHMMAGRSPEGQKEEIKQLLEFVELEQAATRKIAQFSRGMLQRLGLAQVLIGKPKICFLDEPTSGLDPPGMELVRRFLLKLRDDGCTAIVNSHHLDEVERACNRFAFMRKGKIEAQERIESINTKILIARWANGCPARETISEIVQTFGANLIELTESQARIELPERKLSAEIISSLGAHNIKLEEIYFEKSSLSELFKNGRDADPAGGPSAARIDEGAAT